MGKCALASDRSHFCWESGSSSSIFLYGGKYNEKADGISMCSGIVFCNDRDNIRRIPGRHGRNRNILLFMSGPLLQLDTGSEIYK